MPTETRSSLERLSHQSPNGSENITFQVTLI